MSRVTQHISRLSQLIENIDTSPVISHEGVVISSLDGIVKIAGLPECKMSERLIIHTKNGDVSAIALNLEQEYIGAVVMGAPNMVAEGDAVVQSGQVISVPVGPAFLGRVVNPMMEPIDARGPINADAQYPIERVASGVMARQSVDQPLQTGIKVIDALVPIGRGQRELIIGDRQTGKTSLATDAIINQRSTGNTKKADGTSGQVKCIYVAIGQKKSKVMRVVEDLTRAGAMEYTTVVLASASDPAAMLYVSPYSGVALAEYFMDQGDDVLIIYDDLSKHASAYREMSLLLRRPPGREAYPGDVFYLHSRLLERACRRNANYGGGSITALPIIETQAGDISAYIPTNVISITDGQIFLESSLFNKGVRPAINPGLSVSRVGGSAQIKSMKKVAGPLKLALAQFRELESFAQFDSDLDPATKSTLEKGRRLSEIMKQPLGAPLSAGEQVIAIYATTKGYMDSVAITQVSQAVNSLLDYVRGGESELISSIEKGWDDERESKLKTVIETWKSSASL